MEDLELVIVGLITCAGNARSLSIEALRAARQGNFTEADKKIEECDKAMVQAHQIQTNLLQDEAGGKQVKVSLLMVHAQDHLMNAMTVRDLTVEIISILKKQGGVTNA